jgi:Rap guanine nucleotide exchange factor 2
MLSWHFIQNCDLANRPFPFQNTSAREVVMLSLQEFGISECSSNFTLTELTVEGGFMKQKRLPNDQTNLAERIGLASRYYIKNVMSSEQLIADESELAKESQVNLLQLNAVEIAMQIMVEDFKVFRMIGEWTVKLTSLLRQIR